MLILSLSPEVLIRTFISCLWQFMKRAKWGLTKSSQKVQKYETKKTLLSLDGAHEEDRDHRRDTELGEARCDLGWGLAEDQR